jgi:hypothetical protein
MLRSPRISSPAIAECRLIAEWIATTKAIPASHGTRLLSRSIASTWKSVASIAWAIPIFPF